MARRTTWRRSCPDSIRRTLDDLPRLTIYLLHQSGPTGFVLKGENSDRKFKVLLGDVHHCSCPEFMRSKELCVHILWILVKKLRLSQDNPLLFQLGLIEREINDIVFSKSRKAASTATASKPTSSTSEEGCVQRRAITTDDVCPICQEDLLGSSKPMTYCKKSCGKSVHIKCMKIWADHQRTSGEVVVKCPLCREEFCSFQDLQKEMSSSSVRKRLVVEAHNRHLDTSCVNCRMEPICGRCYKCSVCARFLLCQACFTSTASQHGHDFVSRMHPSHQWRSESTPSPVQALPDAMARALEQRDITEQDYDLLLQLDRPTDTSTCVPVPQHVLTRLCVEPLNSDHSLLQSGQTCPVCSQEYARGEWVRGLPCSHQFHRQCIDSWLSSHNTCPLDGLPVHEQQQQQQQQQHRQQNKKKTKKKSSVSKVKTVRVPEMESLPGRTSSLPQLLMVNSFSQSATSVRSGGSSSSSPSFQRSIASRTANPSTLLSVSGLTLGPNSSTSSLHIGPSHIQSKAPPKHSQLTSSKKRAGSMQLPPLTRPPHQPRMRSVRRTAAVSFLPATTLLTSSFVLQNTLH